jgi:hypothetical protein
MRTDTLTWDRHSELHRACRCLRRAIRHVAHGRSPSVVLDVGPAEARKWIRSHPALYLGLVASERRESARGNNERI